MQARREQLQRGTPDLPFARYSFRYQVPRRMVANTHWHPEQEILYVKQGAIEVLIGKSTYTVHENQVCFVTPNALHSVMTSLPNTVYYAFVFSYSLLALPDSHFFQINITHPLQSGSLTFPAVLDESDSHYAAIEPLLETLSHYSQAAPDYKLTVFRTLVCLYAQLQDILIPTDNSRSTTDNLAVKTCLDYMRTHYAQKITLDALAELVHLHPNYLCSLFKTYTGQTAFQQLMGIRLEHAAALLDEGGCSVAEAAELCGFDSFSFFSRKFKQIMGVTPKAYTQHAGKKVY